MRSKWADDVKKSDSKMYVVAVLMKEDFRDDLTRYPRFLSLNKLVKSCRFSQGLDEIFSLQLQIKLDPLSLTRRSRHLLQVYARLRVMRYSPREADDMRRTLCGDDIPSLWLG